MNEEPEKKGNAGAIAAVLVLLPVLYVLSIGPVIRFYLGGTMPPRFVVSFYYPLEWTHKNVRWTRGPLDAYLRLWGVS